MYKNIHANTYSYTCIYIHLSINKKIITDDLMMNLNI